MDKHDLVNMINSMVKENEYNFSNNELFSMVSIIALMQIINTFQEENITPNIKPENNNNGINPNMLNQLTSLLGNNSDSLMSLLPLLTNNGDSNNNNINPDQLLSLVQNLPLDKIASNLQGNKSKTQNQKTNTSNDNDKDNDSKNELPAKKKA